jgi:hypothetical protein
MGIMVVYRGYKKFIPWRSIEEIRDVIDQDRVEDLKKIKEENRVESYPIIIFSITMLIIGVLITYLSYHFISEIPQYGLQRGITAAVATSVIIVGVLGSFLSIFTGKPRIATLLSVLSIIAVISIIIFFGF